MCGIAGVFHLDGEPASPVLLRRMADALRHRGPDGEGYYTDKSLGFAHRRLAILDLSSAGQQPMLSNDGRFAIIYNGEVYNFQELKAELRALGHRFQTRTDTEVVLAAFSQWGLGSIERLNGMFAFAIWDRIDRKLILARDRYGIKPLYYVQVGNAFLFASEIKAFFAYPNYQTQINFHALLEYFTFQNQFSHHSLFEGVRLLAPGHTMSLNAAGNRVTNRYWDFAFIEPERPHKRAEYLEELDRLIRQAVLRQLISDVDVCAYLSGGMDSGTVTALAARQHPYIKTFTVGFDLSSASGVELGFDERQSAEQMSYLFKTEHYEMVLKAGDMQRCMRDLIWHIEDPRVGQSYPNYYAAKLASRFGKVVLAGTGGDELYAGYPWRYYRAAVNDNFEDYIDKYYRFWHRLVNNHTLIKMFEPIAEKVEGVWTRDIMRNVFRDHPDELSRPEDYINLSLYFEAKTFLHGLLVVEDRLSMAHGLETRVPFLDNDLVDFSLRVPVAMKLGNLRNVVSANENDLLKFLDLPKDGKLLLREVMASYVPNKVTSGQKRGFSGPDASWFRGDSIEYVRETLLHRGARIYDYFDYKTTRACVEEHLLGKMNRRLLLWSLLNFETWLEVFASGVGQEAARGNSLNERSDRAAPQC